MARSESDLVFKVLQSLQTTGHCYSSESLITACAVVWATVICLQLCRTEGNLDISITSPGVASLEICPLTQSSSPWGLTGFELPKARCGSPASQLSPPEWLLPPLP